MQSNNTVIISAVNLVEGGGLSILTRCVQEFAEVNEFNKYKIYFLVNNNTILPKYKNITYITYPNAKKNWLFRAFYEYVYFYFLSIKLQPKIWISLHDMTPNVKSGLSVYTYMHNPAPFFEKGPGLHLDLKFKLFIKFYKYIYKLNVKKTTACIVQQNWFREKISVLCNISKDKIIVAKPEYEEKNIYSYNDNYNKGQFFFNSFPRDFKNFEVICKACEVLDEYKIKKDWNVYLTIDGTENKYSRKIVEKYKKNIHIHFIGLISRDKCEEFYQNSETLIFPSLLETWGLPISEFKKYGKKMILADLPYAHEAACGAKQVAFFDPYSYTELASIMESVIMNNNDNIFTSCDEEKIAEPYCKNWKELLSIILK